MRIGVSAPTDSSDAPHIEKKNNKPKRARPAGGRRFSAASTVIAYEAMPSTNCQRHAGARKGQGTLAKLTKKKKKQNPAQLSARKKRDFKPSVWLFSLENHWQFFYSVSSPRWNWSIYTALSRLKAPDKWYLNDSTSEQWSAESACSWTKSPRAWQVLLCGRQQLLKVVGCRVQYGWRLLCTEPCEQTLPADHNRSCSWAWHKVPFTPTEGSEWCSYSHKV